MLVISYPGCTLSALARPPVPIHVTPLHVTPLCRIAQPADSTSLHCTRHSPRQSLNFSHNSPLNSITCCVSPIASRRGSRPAADSAILEPSSCNPPRSRRERWPAALTLSRAVHCAAPPPEPWRLRNHFVAAAVDCRRGSAPPGVTLPDSIGARRLPPRDRRGIAGAVDRLCAWWARFSRSAGIPARAAVW